MDNKAGYATSIVRRWESAARAARRWTPRYATELHGALMRLPPENLLAAGEASTYEEMTSVLAAGPDLADAIGDATRDLVYTPVSPCRIVDTRLAGGQIAAGTQRSFDVDGATFVGQGGFNGSCGVPFGVARSAALIISVQPSSAGHLRAWAAFTTMPTAIVLNYGANQVISNTGIIPVNPGSGADISVFSSAAAHVVIDVYGFFAAPTITQLSCTNAASAFVSVPVNSWTPIDAFCPTGFTATGGGYDTPEGTLGYPGVWVTSLPNGDGWRTWVDNQTNGGRQIQTWVRCCRVPGR